MMLLCVFKSSSIIFVKLDVPEFGALVFEIVMSSWLTVLLVRMKHPSLSVQISFSFESFLSSVRILTSACFLVPSDLSTLIHPFTIRWCLSLKLRYGSYRKQIDGFFFLIHPISLYLWSEN